MFPGFITVYKDKTGFTHFYFFPGISDTDVPFYKDVVLNETFGKYIVKNYSDGAKEFIFQNKKIIGVQCELIDFEGKSHKRNAIIRSDYN